MKNKKVLRVSSKSLNTATKRTSVKTNQLDKKIYIAPKLSYEGKWDTVTMQFGFSTGVP